MAYKYELDQARDIGRIARALEGIEKLLIEQKNERNKKSGVPNSSGPQKISEN
jgi:hypothetical protein